MEHQKPTLSTAKLKNLIKKHGQAVSSFIEQKSGQSLSEKQAQDNTIEFIIETKDAIDYEFQCIGDKFRESEEGREFAKKYEFAKEADFQRAALISARNVKGTDNKQGVLADFIHSAFFSDGTSNEIMPTSAALNKAQALFSQSDMQSLIPKVKLIEELRSYLKQAHISIENQENLSTKKATSGSAPASKPTMAPPPPPKPLKDKKEKTHQDALPSNNEHHTPAPVMRPVRIVAPAPKKNSKSQDIIDSPIILPEAIHTPKKFIGKMQELFDLQATKDSFVNYEPEAHIPTLADKKKWHNYIDILSSKIAEEDKETRTRFQQAIGQFARLKSISTQNTNNHKSEFAEEKCIRKCHDKLLNIGNPSIWKISKAIEEYTAISKDRLGAHDLLGTAILNNSTEFSKLAPHTDFKDFAERLIPMRTTETDEVRRLKEEIRDMLERNLEIIERTLQHTNQVSSRTHSAQRG